MKSANNTRTQTVAGIAGNSSGGFSLIELMVAVALGIMVSIGLVALFGATSKINRVQDAMAQMQENGRYALSRINADLRLVARQRMNNSAFSPIKPTASATPNGAVTAVLAANVYVATIPLPDFDPPVNPTGLLGPPATPLWPANWTAGKPWPLNPIYMVQGYECSSGTCSPTLPASLPAAGPGAGQRVARADVLTTRYINAEGWLSTKKELNTTCAGSNLLTITVTPAAGSATFNFVPGDLAMLSTNGASSVFQVNVAGSTLTPSAPLGGAVHPCPNAGTTDVTLYNFSRDFLTVTYYERLDADPDVPSRLIPALMRRQTDIRSLVNGLPPNDQEVVQGVEQFDVLFGAEWIDGKVSYLDAVQVQALSNVTNCPPGPSQYDKWLPAATIEPNCFWRAIKDVEVHVLLDSIHNMYELTPADMVYQYTYAYNGNDQIQPLVTPPAPTAVIPKSGLTAGSMLRREFVSLASMRSYNP